jgi:hypothetical protein
VAATLTGEQELVYASFPIVKTEETEDGNLIVFGKATDGTVDSDQQIVDVGWSAKALRNWLDTGGNVRVQHNPQRDPAGKGLKLDVTPDGHFVKSLIVEPVAQKLVRNGVLTAYSVGISRPRIDPDPTGKALGGIISGGPATQIVEVSLVDRPANKNCGFQLVAKGAGDQGLEWTGKMWGGDLLTKDLGYDDGNEIVKSDAEADPVPEPEGDLIKHRSVSIEMPEDVSVSFSPGDLAKLHTFAQELGAELAEYQKAADAEEGFLGKKHRKFNASRRRDLARRGHALRDGSYPIPDADALRRAAILARSGHGNVTAARRLIARRAKELGVPNPLSENDAVKKEETVALEVEKAAMCDMCKQPKSECKCMGMKSDGESEVEKGLNRMDADDHDTDSDADEDDKGADKAADANANADVTAKAKKPKSDKGKGKPPWLQDGDGDDDDAKEKAAKPTPADGVTGMTAQPVPAHMEPDGPDIEAFEGDAGMPTVPDSSVKTAGGETADSMSAAVRFKSLGIAHQLGVLHDLCCPVFTPGDVAKAHPNDSFTGIDLMFFASKAMDMAATGSLEEAARATALWTHAQTLKSVGIADMQALQEEAHKAFRDANPGVSSFPTPGHISAERFRRGSITAGHAADSPGHEGPHTAPVPAGQISASQFGRSFIQDGHAADSPANKGQGVPSRTEWVPTIRENAQAAMRAMHDHVAQTFPDVCALGPDEPHGIMSRPVPVPQGTPPVHAAKIADEEAALSKMSDLGEDDVFKAQKKLRKKLGKKVLSGKMTVDEARAKIGRAVAQKAGGQTTLGVTGALGMSGMKSEVVPAEPAAPAPAATEAFKAMYPVQIVNGGGAGNGFGVQPDVVKSAVEAAVEPLLERLASYEEIVKRQGEILDSLAGLPDPNVAAFRGMAVKSARPAGMQTVPEIAERTQATLFRELEVQWRTNPDPVQREAAWRSLQKMRGMSEAR